MKFEDLYRSLRRNTRSAGDGRNVRDFSFTFTPVCTFVSLRPAMWSLESGTLYPSRCYIESLNSFLCSRPGDDCVITFKFDTAGSMQILTSRLEHAGGPLRAITQHAFSERETGTVTLRADSVRIFGLLRDALYGKKLELRDLNLTDLIQLLKAAHRWQLMHIFVGVSKYLWIGGRLNTADDVLAVVEVVSLPDVPADVLIYFWRRVGVLFRHFGGVRIKQKGKDVEEELKEQVPGLQVSFEGATEEELDVEERDDLPVEVRLNPLFINMWPLALSHGLVDIALHHILINNDYAVAKALLDVVLQYLEPRLTDDETICDLIALLGLNVDDLVAPLSDEKYDTLCSSRAMRLLAKTSHSDRIARDEIRHSWPLNLHEAQDFTKEIFFFPETRQMRSLNVRDSTDMIVQLSPPRDQGRKRIRPSKFETLCQGAIRMTVGVECEPEDCGFFYMTWTGGRLYRGCGAELVIMLQVRDDRCRCGSGRSGCLVDVRERRTVEDGEFSVCLDVDCLSGYHLTHGPSCEVTVALVVQFVEGGS